MGREVHCVWCKLFGFSSVNLVAASRISTDNKDAIMHWLVLYDSYDTVVLEMMWWLYVLACADGTLYTGVTTNIDRRLHEHNHVDSKGAKYTRTRRPVRLLVKRHYLNRAEAQAAEYKFKKLSRTKKLERIEEWIRTQDMK